MAQQPKSYVLRGYIKQRPDGRFVGICLAPNLAVEADSTDEALFKLRELIEAYMVEAMRDGHLDHFMAQKAPASFWLEYWIGRGLTFFHSMRRSFFAFSEVKPTPAHA